MSEKGTRQEHPLPAILMHWAHLLAFFILIATGLLIHNSVQGFATVAAMRQTHFIAMYVFMLTTVVRIYWAFFGGGSAIMGSTRKISDWRHFALTGRDFRTLFSWIGYYLFLRKTRPYTAKYNPLQKLTYGYLFPLGTLIMALSGFALFAPTAAAMTWYTVLLGGLNTVRLVHFMGMWVLIAVFLIHLYLVLAEDLKQASMMLFATVPEKYRVAGDYPSESLPGGSERMEA